MNIVVKKQTEFMNALLLNSDFAKNPTCKKQIKACLDSDYTAKLNAFFKNAIIDHPTQARELLSSLNEVISQFDTFAWYGKYDLFLCLDDDYNFDSKKYFDSNNPISSTKGQEVLLYSFMNKVGDFARICDFDAFYKANQQHYLKQINAVKKSMTTCLQQHDMESVYNNIVQGKSISSIESRLNDFLKVMYGEDAKTNDYTMNIIMSMASGGCSTTLGDEKYIVETGNIGQGGNVSIVPAGDVGFIGFASHICHEISHAYVNPQTEKLNEKELSSLIGFENDSTLEHDGFVSEYINESIIRAIQNVFANSLTREYATNIAGMDMQDIERKINQMNSVYYKDKMERGFTCVGEIQQRIEETFSKEYNDFGERYKDIANVIMPDIECNNVFEDKMLINSEA